MGSQLISSSQGRVTVNSPHTSASRMRWVTFSVAIMAATAPTARAQGFFTNFLNAFDNRNNYEAAPYQVISSTADYEERFYPAKKWACTEKEGTDERDIANGMFMKLFRYISGSNVKDEAIKMTVPVSIQVSRKARQPKVQIHRMCFYIGEKHQANTPQPTNPQVFIEDRQAFTVLTRREPGNSYMNPARWNAEAKALSDILTAAGESFATEPMWRVGYDSPMKFWDRRNEVWFRKN